MPPTVAAPTTTMVAPVALRAQDRVAVAFPFAGAREPVTMTGFRFLGKAGTRLLAQPIEGIASMVRADQLALFDGTGALRKTLDINPEAPLVDRSGGFAFTVIGDLVIAPTLQTLWLTSGVVQELSSDHRLVGSRGEVLLVRSEVCNDGECTFATMTLDGTALATVPAPVMPYNVRVRTGLITADGSTAVFGWVAR